MQEKTILKVSFVIIIIGLAFLFLYSEEVDVKQVSRIDAELPEESVTVRGKIGRVSVHDKVIFLELLGERVEKMDVILFTDREVFLNEGDYVEVSGTIEEYEGKKEIIGNKISIK